MKTRIFAMMLIIVLLVGIVPVDASASEAYVVGNNVTVPNADVPIDGSNPYCECNLTVGSSGHWCCWQYAAGVHRTIWGVAFNRYSDSTLYLRDVPASERTLTAENLAKYLRNAAPGAVLRMDKSYDPSARDSRGHSLVFVQMNDAGDGAVFLEGNHDGCGRSRLYEWKFVDLVNTYGPGSRRDYQYIKYISWPNAPSYTSCEHSYEGAGICSVCDYQYPITINTNDSGVYTVVQTVMPQTGGPYSQSAADTISIDAGAQIDVYGSVMNAYNDKWYQISYDNGKTGYVHYTMLELLDRGTQEVGCNITSPGEWATIPRAAYPVIGTLTSKYPLQKVEAYIDGTKYASIVVGNTYTFDFRSSAINSDLSFSALTPGIHWLTITAQDIHRSEPSIVATRYFIIEGDSDGQDSYTCEATVTETADGNYTVTPDVTGGNGTYAYNYWLFDADGQIVDRHENTYDTSWTFQRPASGVYLVRVYATDFVSETQADSAWFAVSDTEDAVSVDDVAVTENEDGTYTATADVTGSSEFFAFNYWLFDATGTIVERHENTFDTSWTFEKPADGIYLMRIYATDFTTDAYSDSSWFAVASPYENVAVSNVTVTENEDGTYTATADVTGGSGFYAYNYWLFDSTGTIVDRHENTFDTSWTFEKPENGIYLMRIYATDFTTDSHGDGPWFAVAD